ncbi:MAG: hypothetical protein LQ349_006002 [Xanthoria aureola]|nr:MAG: hypothetical protein LQ349_006002 [Xanthoria aureola]
MSVGTLLPIKSVKELFEDNMIRVEGLAGRQLVHAFPSHPYSGQKHLHGANTSPLEIDQTFDSPVAINEDVIRMDINEIEIERPVTKAGRRARMAAKTARCAWPSDGERMELV